MMDLTKAALPNTVEVGGKAYSVYTDFRLWMKFEIALSHMKSGDHIEVGYLFKNEMPLFCPLEELTAFSRPKDPLPRAMGKSDVIVLDYELDADLIYAAFLGQYGVDLLKVEDMHWYQFLALIKGLNESTKLREVMGYRCYESRNDSKRNPYEELRAMWEIERISQEDEAELMEFSKIFER